MLRKPPGIIAIASATAVLATSLFMSWNLGGDLRADLIFMTLATPLLVVFFLVWGGLAFRRMDKTVANVVRVLLCPVLLSAGFVFVASDVPMRVRFALSRPSLDAYVRDLRHLPVGQPCDVMTFQKRRVGLFTVTCAERPDADTTSLRLDSDPLSPHGVWYLVWSRDPDPDADRLSTHWSFALQD
ncbi:MAG TPA: hypothetical protein VIL71_09700 [Spirillospora sp.]